MGSYTKVLNVRVSDEMKLWAGRVGMEAVRSILEVAMAGNVPLVVEPAVEPLAKMVEVSADVSPAGSAPVEAVTRAETVVHRGSPVYDKSVKVDRMTKGKRAKAAAAVTQAEAPRKPGIPTDPGERAAWFEAARRESEAKAARVAAYKAGLNPVHRRILGQFLK